MRFRVPVVMLALFFALCSAAFAADAPYTPVTPVIPEFLTLSGSSAQIKVPYDKTSSAAKAFFSDFYDKPYLIFVGQETWNDYIPPVRPGTGSTIQQEYVGEDKHWTLTFVKLISSSNGFYLQVKDPNGPGMDAIKSQPMTLHKQTPNAEFGQSLTYTYDYSAKKFGSPVYRSSLSQPALYFSYLVGCSPVANLMTIGTQQFGKLLSPDKKVSLGFTVDVADNSGKLYPYNWWLGKNPVQDGFDDGGGDTSSDNASSGGSSSSGGESSGPEEEKKFRLIINYVYADGSRAAPPYIGYGKTDDTVRVTSPSISGYLPDKPFVTFVFKWDDTVTVVYRKDGTTAPEYGEDEACKIYFTFVYEDGTQAAPPAVWEFKKGETKPYYYPKISGFHPDNLYMYPSWVNGDRHVTIVYHPDNGGSSSGGESSDSGGSSSSDGGGSGGGDTSSDGGGSGDGGGPGGDESNKDEFRRLVIRYVFADGTQAAPPYTANLIAGSSYRVKSPSIPGYYPNAEVVSGTVSQYDFANTYTVVYRKDGTTAPEHGEDESCKIYFFYVYPDGTEAAPPAVWEIHKGDYKPYYHPVIPGYHPEHPFTAPSWTARDRYMTIVYLPNDDSSGGGSPPGGGGGGGDSSGGSGGAGTPEEPDYQGGQSWEWFDPHDPDYPKKEIPWESWNPFDFLTPFQGPLVSFPDTVPGPEDDPGATLPTPGTGSATLPTPGTGSATLPTPGTGSATLPTPGTGSATLPTPGTGSATLPTPGTGSVTLPTPDMGATPLPEPKQ